MKTIGVVLISIGAFAAGIVTGSYISKRKYDTIMNEAIDKEVSEFREHYRAKEKELQEEKEKIEKVRYKEIVENYKEKAKDEDQKQYEYPTTEEEIEEYNFDNDLYKGLEFITEEDFKYDEDDIVDKIECRMYSDGSVYDVTGQKLNADDLGNLCSGMGIEDCQRYIRNWELKTDFRVEYFDEEGPDE